MRSSKPTRGATLVEVLVASVVMLIGLAGVLQVLILAMGRFRDSDVKVSSTAVLASTLAEYKTRSFGQLAAGTEVLAPAQDDVGRAYTRQVLVRDIGDGGVGAWRVEVTVQWTQRVGAVGLDRSSVGAIIVSEVLDGGF